MGGRDATEVSPRLIMRKECKTQGVALGVATKEEIFEMRRAIEDGVRQSWINPQIGSKYSLKDLFKRISIL